MKALFIFLVQVLIVVGLVIGAVYWLELDSGYVELIVAVGAALILIFSLLLVVPGLLAWVRKARRSKSSVKEDNRRRARKNFNRACRNHFRSTLRKVMAAERQRFFYRESLGRPWWVVVGAKGAGKSTWIQEYLGAEEVGEPPPGHSLRYFESPALITVEVTVGGLGNELEDELAVLVRELGRLRPDAPISGCVFVCCGSQIDEEQHLAVQKVLTAFQVEVPIVVVRTRVDGFTSARTVLEKVPAASLVEWYSDTPESVDLQGSRLLCEMRRRVLNTLVSSAERSPRNVVRFFREFEGGKIELEGGVLRRDRFRTRAIIYASDRAGLVVEPQVFQSHLVRESSNARRTQGFSRWRLQRYGFGACIVLLITGVFSWGAVRGTRERQDFLESTIETVRGLNHGTESGFADPERFISALPIAEVWQTGGPQKSRQVGLVDAEAIFAGLSDTYVRLMCQGVLRPLVKDTEVQLRKFLEGEGRDEKEVLTLLRVYLLLSWSQNNQVPEPWTGAESLSLAVAAAEQWNAAVGDKVPESRLTQLQRVLTLYGRFVGEADSRTLGTPVACSGDGLVRVHERDVDLVRGVQREILKQRQGSKTLEAILEKIELEIGIESVEGVAPYKNVHGQPKVRGAFTREGWKRMQAHLDTGSQLTEPVWLIDPLVGREERLENCRSLAKRYTEEYQSAWESLIGSIEVDTPVETLADALVVYSGLVGRRKPLATIFAKVNHHTNNLKSLHCSNSLFDGWAKDSTVTIYFKELNNFTQKKREEKDGEKSRLDVYHGWIGDLQSEVKMAREKDDLELLETAIPTTKKKLGEALKEAKDWEAPLRGILVPPIEALQVLVDVGPLGQQNEKWCATVVRPLRQVTAQYPFSAKAHRDASIKTLRMLFHPVEGEIAKFRRQFLASKLDDNGDPIKHKYPVRESVAKFLKQSHDLGVLLFPEPDGKSIVDVILNCNSNISPVELTIGAKKVTFRCTGDRHFSWEWPGSGGAELGYGFKQPGRQTAFGYIREEREFALFRLLEGGELRRGTGHSVVATFKLPKLGELPVNLSFGLVTDQAREGSLLYGFEKDASVFLSPFRALPEPPVNLYYDVPPTRCSSI